MSDEPKLVGWYIEWHFDKPMPEWLEHGADAEAILLAKVGGDDGMAFPVEAEGRVHGFLRPKAVSLLSGGHVMRISFDTADVSMPVYPGASNPEED